MKIQTKSAIGISGKSIDLSYTELQILKETWARVLDQDEEAIDELNVFMNKLTDEVKSVEEIREELFIPFKKEDTVISKEELLIEQAETMANMDAERYAEE